MNAGPSRGGAGRPEKRVMARSKLPQKKWAGLHLPTNPRRALGEDVADLHEQPPEALREYGVVGAVHVSSSKRMGSGISTGIGQM
ncbi:MAG: hypothetical protein R2712_30735 [Vicinamibacterales bacterium]